MKEKLKKVFVVNNFVLILEMIFIISSLIYLFKFDNYGTPISYVLYLLMTYSLICIITKIYILLKKIIIKIFDSNSYLKKYKDDIKVRYKISLFISTGINMFYVLFKLISGILYESVWFIAFALYYLWLVLMRTNIVKEEIKKERELKEEYIKYRKIGIRLLFMNVILTIIILIIVNQRIIIKYPMQIAIAIAAYTFYILISSIVSLIKYRKFKSPLMSASKVIDLVKSLISMLSLEVVMLSCFGMERSWQYKETLLMSTGGGISLIIIIISLYMIIKSTEWLKEN